MAYAKRYTGGFVDLPTQTTAIDSTFLNAVEAALLKLFDTDPTVDGQIQSWVAASTKFGPALILNKNVDAAAAIAASKLDFSGANGIIDANVKSNAAIAITKLANLSDSTVVLRGDGTWGRKVTVSSMAGGPPGSPVDGDIWIATAVDANGTRWQFQYNSGSASSFKWEFVGGAALFKSDSTHTWTQVASGTNQDPGVTGTLTNVAAPTLARAGDYLLTCKAVATENSSGGHNGSVIGGVNGVAGGAVGVGTTAAGSEETVITEDRYTVAAGQTLGMLVNTSVASGHVWSHASLKILPVRIS